MMAFSKVLFFCFGILISLTATAQPTEEGRKAMEQVYNVLSGKESNVQDVDKNLQRGAWEALSYIDESADMKMEQLSEAVPDYYNFKNGLLILKLINPQNYNEYGVELKVGYRINKSEIQLFDSKTGKVKDQWEIMYLDQNYMALDLGDLRVFFTHTPLQE